ncbi:MAG TPA: transposase [Ktedonobacteraceae bacterium]
MYRAVVLFSRAFRVDDRENEQAWKDLMDDLKAPGVKEVGLWISCTIAIQQRPPLDTRRK